MTLELLLDGTEAPYLNKPDNMDIDEKGHLLIQEDPGGNAHLARVLAYEIASGDIATLAEFDPARFASGATGYPATIDEESSGIIDVADLMGRGTFLLDAQVHTSVGLSDPTRQVEHGQLLKMKVNWATSSDPRLRPRRRHVPEEDPTWLPVAGLTRAPVGPTESPWPHPGTKLCRGGPVRTSRRCPR